MFCLFVEVLLEQLGNISKIPVEQQVLILLNLDDPDRNTDRVIDLEAAGHRSLREIGIVNNAVLTLHSLGAVKQSAKERRVIIAKKPEIRHRLNTVVHPRQADHCFNGIIFNIASKGPYEVVIKSIFLGGMLGHITILARDRPWEQKAPNEAITPTGQWWAYRESVSRIGWKIVKSCECAPSWDHPFEIELDEPVTLLPYQQIGFYCHSALPDDLGIQYNTHTKDQIVCENEHIVVTPGLGHAGKRLFDDHDGWYRAYRGPCGGFGYTAAVKGWSIWNHRLFPAPFKQSVKAMLQANYQSIRFHNILRKLPRFLVAYIMEVRSLSVASESV
jgi:hypothetical protein